MSVKARNAKNINVVVFLRDVRKTINTVNIFPNVPTTQLTKE